jgi:hypothetical protein
MDNGKMRDRLIVRIEAAHADLLGVLDSIQSATFAVHCIPLNVDNFSTIEEKLSEIALDAIAALSAGKVDGLRPDSDDLLDAIYRFMERLECPPDTMSMFDGWDSPFGGKGICVGVPHDEKDRLIQFAESLRRIAYISCDVEEISKKRHVKPEEWFLFASLAIDALDGLGLVPHDWFDLFWTEDDNQSEVNT